MITAAPPASGNPPVATCCPHSQPSQLMATLRGLLLGRRDWWISTMASLLSLKVPQAMAESGAQISSPCPGPCSHLHPLPPHLAGNTGLLPLPMSKAVHKPFFDQETLSPGFPPLPRADLHGRTRRTTQKAWLLMPYKVDVAHAPSKPKCLPLLPWARTQPCVLLKGRPFQL